MKTSMFVIALLGLLASPASADSGIPNSAPAAASTTDGVVSCPTCASSTQMATLITEVSLPPLPFNFTPVAPGQYAVPITTIAKLAIPPGANYVFVTVEGGAARYTYDGTTPTATVGFPLAPGPSLRIDGPAMLAGFQIIGAGATMTAGYAK